MNPRPKAIIYAVNLAESVKDLLTIIKRRNPAAVALGKLGGKVKSEAKAAAARENGKKGGRPKKAKQ